MTSRHLGSASRRGEGAAAWRLDPRPRPTSRPAARLGARCPIATDSEACRGGFKGFRVHPNSSPWGGSQLFVSIDLRSAWTSCVKGSACCSSCRAALLGRRQRVAGCLTLQQAARSGCGSRYSCTLHDGRSPNVRRRHRVQVFRGWNHLAPSRRPAACWPPRCRGGRGPPARRSLPPSQAVPRPPALPPGRPPRASGCAGRWSRSSTARE